MDKSFLPSSLLVDPGTIQSLKTQSLRFPSYSLEPRQLCELELLLLGALAPLTGFMGEDDFHSVLSAMRLTDGTVWPVPVSLDVPDALADKLGPGTQLALRDGEGFMLAVLTVESVFSVEPRQAAAALFGTDDPDKHPGVAAYLSNTQTKRLSGSLAGLALPTHCDFPAWRRSPAALRESLAQNGWRTVMGYHCDTFPHKGERAAVLRAALAHRANILMLQPACDTMAPGAEHFAAVRCAGYFAATLPQASVMCAILPYHPLGAGPRQALLEALIHKNYGCTYFLVSPTHGDPQAERGCPLLYPVGAAQELVAAHANQIGIAMLPKETMVYVEDSAQYVPLQSAPTGCGVKTLSWPEVRRRLESGLDIPDWYAAPDIVNVLRHTHPPRSKQGLTLFMTGLSGAGKSTLAKLLYVKLMELGTRPVTLLDGDIVRRHLSSELTFSKAHRNLNIERIGYVASEITKNGGIAICAPIAPYSSSRNHARELVSRFGGFVEIHVSTPLAVCEQRDRKGLYAKARAGVVKGVTGIDDPYEIPEDPEIVLDSSALSPAHAVQDVLLYLERENYLA